MTKDRFLENCKNKYKIIKSKRIPRLTELELNIDVDESTRKLIIKKYFELIRSRHNGKCYLQNRFKTSFTK